MIDCKMIAELRFRSVEMRFRSTLVDPNAFPIRTNALSLDACRPKCLSGVLKDALARRLSIKMRIRSVEMRARSAHVDPNASPVRSNALSRDACRSKCVSYVLRWLSLDACRAKCLSGVLKDALARRLSIQTRFRYAKMRSRSTPVDPNARKQMLQTSI